MISKEQVFNFITEEYTLILAVSSEDFSFVKKIRKEILLPKYSNFATIDDEDTFLFNKEDKQSFVYLLQHKETKQFVGTIRVFFVNNYTEYKQMPMEHYSNSIQLKELSQSSPIGEISRLALSNKLVNHKGLSAIRLRVLLSMTLMISTRINMLLYGYSTIFSIMEPSLDHILRRQSVKFEKIGEPVDYYGMRTPYAIERKKLLMETEETMGDITRFYLRELCANPDKFWKFIDDNPYLERSDMQLDRICKLFEEHGDDVNISLLMGD